MIVLCVLRAGREYGPAQVSALQSSLREHSDARLVCLSDVDVPCEHVVLRHDWPGWWSKIELFAYDWKEPVLYVDLDTVFIGNPEPLLRQAQGLTMLARVGMAGDVGSGVMSWSGDHSRVYRAFKQDPAGVIRKYRTTQNWGDQGFIRDTVGRANIDTFPRGAAVSFKAECTRNGNPNTYRLPNRDARILYFHGRPRPWEVPPVWK